MTRGDLRAIVIGAESAIDNAKLQLQMHANEPYVVVPAIEDAIRYITPLLKYENQQIETLNPKPSEWLQFLERKKYEIEDPDNLFEQLRRASSITDLDSFYEEDCEEIIEECTKSNNIHDKLALAIAYSFLGNEYYDKSVTLFNEYINTNPSNPCYTPKQLLYLLASIHEKYEGYSKAVEVYIKLIDIDFENPFLFEKMINVFIKMSRVDLAWETLDLAKRTEWYKLDYFKFVIDKIKI